MGLINLLLVIFIVAKLFGAAALVAVSWWTIFGVYLTVMVALFLLAVMAS